MDWLTPTRRAVRWAPLAVMTAASTATLALLRLADRPLRGQLLLCLPAMIVLGALCGLHDPGRDFVQAMPLSAARRLAHRLTVLVPVGVISLLAVRQLAGHLFTVLPPSPGWRAFGAFGAAGVATTTVLVRRIGPRAAEVAVSVMLAWLAFGVVLVELDVPLGLALPWWRWPALVGGVAVVVTWLATARGVEA